MGGLGRAWGGLGEVLGDLGEVLGIFGGLGGSWRGLGGVLGASWSALGTSWELFWHHLDDLVVSWERLGAMDEKLQKQLITFDSILEPKWTHKSIKCDVKKQHTFRHVILKI